MIQLQTIENNNIYCKKHKWSLVGHYCFGIGCFRQRILLWLGTSGLISLRGGGTGIKPYSNKMGWCGLEVKLSCLVTQRFNHKLPPLCSFKSLNLSLLVPLCKEASAKWKNNTTSIVQQSHYCNKSIQMFFCQSQHTVSPLTFFIHSYHWILPSTGRLSPNGSTFSVASKCCLIKLCWVTLALAVV